MCGLRRGFQDHGAVHHFRKRPAYALIMHRAVPLVAILLQVATGLLVRSQRGVDQ